MFPPSPSELPSEPKSSTFDAPPENGSPSPPVPISPPAPAEEWETIEKPSTSSLGQSTESLQDDEGEKIEADGSDEEGVKVEAEEGGDEGLRGSKDVQGGAGKTEEDANQGDKGDGRTSGSHGLLKDW